MTAIPVDFNALAVLRPGEAKEMLARALGHRWREPAPHQEGLVKSIARVHGFHDLGHGGAAILDVRDEARQRQAIAAEHALDKRHGIGLPGSGLGSGHRRGAAGF